MNFSSKRSKLITKITLFVLSIVLILSLIQTKRFLNEERHTTENEAEFIRLGIERSDASDYLTWAIRQYVVTLNPIFIQRYWREVDIDQHREDAISRLKALSGTVYGLQMLERAKKDSDTLISRETRAMKLVLTVFKVPEKLMHPLIRDFKLSKEDLALDDAEKINMARQIVFDDIYNRAKEKIMGSVAEFQRDAHATIQTNAATTAKKTNQTFLLCIVLLGLIFIVASLLVWAYKPLEHRLTTLEQ